MTHHRPDWLARGGIGTGKPYASLPAAALALAVIAGRTAMFS